MGMTKLKLITDMIFWGKSYQSIYIIFKSSDECHAFKETFDKWLKIINLNTYN